MNTRSFSITVICTLALAGCARDVRPGDEVLPPDELSDDTDPAEGAPADAVRVAGESKRPASEPGALPEPSETPPVEPAREETPVWKETSARIHIQTRNYWLGGMRFERAVEELDAEQVELVRGLRRIAPEPDYCIYDALEATVTVVDADGSSESFEMENATCRHEGPLLTEASLRPLLRSLGCLTRGSFGGTQNGVTLPEGETPTVVANDGCTHGLYESPPWLLLEVTDAEATYTIESLDCEHDEVELALFDDARETLLASGRASEPAGCAVLTYEFAAPGRYAIHVTGAGEYSLRVTAE